jgi:hypothetical protein
MDAPMHCLSSAARATGSTIRAEKIRINGIGPNPEIELDINSVNVFEVYYNRSVAKVEFQVRHIPSVRFSLSCSVGYKVAPS